MYSLVIQKGMKVRASKFDTVRKLLSEVLFGSIIPVSDENVEIQLPDGSLIRQTERKVDRNVNMEGKHVLIMLTSESNEVIHAPRVNGKVNSSITAKDKGYQRLVLLNKFFNAEGIPYAVKRNSKGMLLLNTDTNEVMSLEDIKDKTVRDLISLVLLTLGYATESMLIVVDSVKASDYSFALVFFNEVLKIPLILSEKALEIE